MRAHYLQHVPFEGLGSIENWLTERGFEITSTKLFDSFELPDPESIDLLVIMGGPMSVNDVKQFPWLEPELRFIKQVIQLAKPILGICLGAQLIARALGAEVYANTEKEIGWFPVNAIKNNSSSCFSFPPTITVFHWHGETFDLPQGASHLARSSTCENQAFQYKENVIGLQFHLETTPDSARALVDNCSDEICPAPFIQSEEEILSVNQETYLTINRLMGKILSYLTNL